MADSPSQITGAPNLNGPSGFNLIDIDNASQNLRQLNSDQAKPLALLEKAVKACKQHDGRSRLILEQNSATVKFKSRWYAFFHPHQVARANRILKSKLQGLQDLQMSDQDRGLLNGILDKLEHNSVDAQDIVKLHRLTSRVEKLNESEGNDVRFAEMALKKYGETALELVNKGMDNMTITWSDEHGCPVLRDRMLTTESGRKEAGEWLAAMFKPLKQQVERSSDLDEGAGYKEFQRLMSRLEKGELKSDELVDLMKVVQGAKNPNQNARGMISYLYNSARDAGRGKSITWRDRQREFKVTNRRNMTEMGRLAAGRRFYRVLRGLQFKRPETEVQKQDMATLVEAANFGDLKSDHVFYLQGRLEQEANPTAYALKELDRLNAMAEKAGDNKSITWRNNDLNFKMTDRTWMTKPGRKQAAARIEDRLDPLMSIFKEGTQQMAAAKLWLDDLKSGKGTSTDIKALKDLVEEQKFLTHQNDYLASERIILPAISDLNALAISKTPKMGKDLEKQLSVLKPLVSVYQKDRLQDFSDFLGKIGNNQATSQDIQSLNQLVNTARGEYLGHTGEYLSHTIAERDKQEGEYGRESHGGSLVSNQEVELIEMDHFNRHVQSPEEVQQMLSQLAKYQDQKHMHEVGKEIDKLKEELATNTKETVDPAAIRSNSVSTTSEHEDTDTDDESTSNTVDDNVDVVAQAKENSVSKLSGIVDENNNATGTNPEDE